MNLAGDFCLFETQAIKVFRSLVTLVDPIPDRSATLFERELFPAGLERSILQWPLLHNDHPFVTIRRMSIGFDVVYTSK